MLEVLSDLSILRQVEEILLEKFGHIAQVRHRDERLDGTQANWKMESREGPALHRLRQGPARQVLRGLDVGKKSGAATRRAAAIARRH